MCFQAIRRRQLASLVLLAAALATIAALAVALAPFALALASTRRWPNRRTLRKEVVLVGSVVASFWRASQGESRRPGHPCARCGLPIEPASRGRYSSPSCRRLGVIERHASEGDERAQQRLERLARLDAVDPALMEIPF